VIGELANTASIAFAAFAAPSTPFNDDDLSCAFCR